MDDAGGKNAGIVPTNGADGVVVFWVGCKPGGTAVDDDDGFLFGTLDDVDGGAGVELDDDDGGTEDGWLEDEKVCEDDWCVDELVVLGVGVG